jgi:hypothetical protein
MRLEHWYEKLQQKLEQVIPEYRRLFLIEEDTPLPSAEEALRVVEGYVLEAGDYFEVPIRDARALALISPSDAAWVWCDAILLRRPEKAREKARSIVASAMELGYHETLTREELSKYTYKEFRDKQLQDYEELLAKGYIERDE